jgi:D-alanyl-D-alanine carboxypeptidase
MAIAVAMPMLAQAQAQARTQYPTGRCVSTRGLERMVSAFQKSASATNGTPGIAATVFDKDGIVASAAAGVRSLNTQVPLEADDRFNLASNTKHMLAISLAQLVDQGRLSYDAQIGTLLPDMASAMQPAFRDVTVRQLLTMTAGLGSFNGTDPGPTAAMIDALNGMHGNAVEQRRQITQFFLQNEPAYAPGKGQLYSNASFVVLGTIYERLAGRPYEQAGVESVFGRVGASATFGLALDLGPNNPSLHFPMEDGSILTIDDPAQVPDAAMIRVPAAVNSGGGMVASMPAFARVEQQLLRASMGLEQSLASNAALRDLFEPVGEYGFGGIEKIRAGARTAYVFTGNMPAGSAVTFLVPDAGVGAVLATNSALNPFEALGAGQDMAFMMKLAERARLGVMVAGSSDQAAVFGAVDALCAAANGEASPIVQTFGELTRAQSSALAERIAPDDSRMIDRLSAAPMEAMLGHLDMHLSIGGNALRGRSAGGEAGWRAFLAGGSLGGRAVAGTTGSAGDISASTRLTSPQIGLALAYDGADGLFGDLRATFARQRISTTRDLAIDGLDLGTTRGRRSGFGTVIDGSLGYALGTKLRVAPIAGLRFTRNAVDRLQESGSLLSLSIDDRRSYRLDARAGISIAGEFAIGTAMIRPSVEAFRVRTIAESSPDWTARLDAAGPAMRFAAAPIDRNWTMLRGGIDVDAGNMGFQLGAGGTVGRDGRNDLQLSGGMRFRF